MVQRAETRGLPSPEDRLEQLESFADSSLGYLSLEEMLGEVLDRVRGALDADTAALLLMDAERGVLVARAARGLEEEVRQGVQVPLARGFAGRIAAEGRPRVIDDLSKADVVNPILRQRGISSMLGVPVHVEGRVIGVMHVGTLRRREFVEDDITLLQFAADRVALRIDNATLSEQRSVTAIMQRTLLPEAFPVIPGLRFSAKYLPAGSGIKMGGDWYDVYPLADGRVTCVVGDVVGRGVLAASVMAEIRTAFRAYLNEGHDPSSAMELLNDLLVSMGRDRTATLAVAQLDLETSELLAVSAGHPPAVLVTPDGGTQLIEPRHGLLLGIKRGVKFYSQRYPFPAGSVLLLYTDGLIERRDESLDEGLERLAAVAADAAQREEDSFADRVYRSLIEQASSEDDIALLAVEWLPIDRSLAMTLEARPTVLAGMRRTLGRWLAGNGVNEDDTFDVTLSTSEAAANAIEHAYGAKEGQVLVEAVVDEREVRVTVRDWGRWREARHSSGGRGLTIIGGLVDSVGIDRHSGGTTVSLVKRLQPPR